ncbi:hypothetical protein [Leptospira bouyouniensis]|uniref:Lipoprotein n=1 Tax=Leptospira bouyouniensis TaxID=2484911 RepID=A0ABY2L6K3_9LEPT|nr:hypothetical protein [Leptospira bouyouniensis]TGK48373.1 hypothetical protein EHQ10_11645 [Leptospira bouyouniensis]
MKQLNLVYLSVLLVLSHCISFAKYNLPETKLTENANAEKKIILLTYSQAATVGDRERKVADESDRKQSEDRFVRALQSHPRVLSVVTDPQSKYDLKLDIQLESQVSLYSSTLGMILTGISYLTLTSLPMDVEQDSTITFQFANEKSKSQTILVRQVHFRTWIGILTIPLMPFYGLNGTTEKTFLNVSHSALNEALEKQPKLFY